MPGSLSPTPPPSDAESRGSKEQSPTQRSARAGSADSAAGSVSPNLPPTRAELEGYSSLVGSLALRDATSLGPALLGTPLWSPTPHLSEAGSSPDRQVPLSRRSSGPSGIFPTPVTADRNERRLALRRERAAFRASLPGSLLPGGSERTQHEERRRTLWPEYPAHVLAEPALPDVVQEAAHGMAVRERLRRERPAGRARATVSKPRDRAGRFVPAPAAGARDEEDDELDSDMDGSRISGADDYDDDDDDELPPDVAQHIAADVQAHVDRTLAALAACRAPATDRARGLMDPLDWQAVVAAAALTVDPAIIARTTARLETLFQALPADDAAVHAHRMRVLGAARAAPAALLQPRDDVFARTRVSETRARQSMDKSRRQSEREARRAEKAAAAAARAAAQADRTAAARKKRRAANRAAERKRAEREARDAAQA